MVFFVVLYGDLSQLKRMYEKSWEEIPGNCDTMLYLGGKDQSTNEFIMKELGKETIDTLSKNKSKGKTGSTSYNDGIMGRELMQLNELSTLDNSECIVMVRGINPFLTDKFDIKNHPNYRELDEANKERNTYYLSENIKTQEVEHYIDFSEYFDDNDVLSSDNEEINLSFTYNEETLYTMQELTESMYIKPEVRELFSNIA